MKQLRTQLEGQRQAHEHELALLAAQLKQETEAASAMLQQDAVAAEGTEFEGQVVALQQAQAAAQERLREWRTALLQQQQEVEAESAAALASMQVCCCCQCFAGNACNAAGARIATPPSRASWVWLQAVSLPGCLQHLYTGYAAH